MVKPVNFITPVQQAELLNIRSSDTWRDGEVVRLKGIVAKAIFGIKQFFTGGWAANDRKAFEDFYTRIQGNFQLLQGKLERDEDLDSVIPQVQTMLKIQAKICNSSWAKSLGKFKPYSDFLKQVDSLRELAAGKVDRWAGADPLKRMDISRWIHSNREQRRFAAHLNLKNVPYRFEEIPRGAVILTDPFLYLLNTRLKKHGNIAKTIFLHIKAFLCWLGTGKVHTHAELSLGNGEAFDLDKKDGSWVSGVMKIPQRTGKVCYGAIVVPNEALMMEEHRKCYLAKGLEPFNTFQELMDDMEREARSKVHLIKAGFHDIIKTALTSKRPSDYDCTLAWQPGVKGYGCSATTSALFSKYGIDIGKQFKIKDENVAPADFLTSRLFKHLFVAKSGNLLEFIKP